MCLETSLYNLLSVLPNLSTLQSLDISENRFNEESLKRIFGHGLRNKDLYPKLVKLKMQDIELGLHEESAMFDSLLSLLANNRKLQ